MRANLKNKNDFPPAAASASASASTLALSPATPAAALSDCFSHFFASFFFKLSFSFFIHLFFFVFFILSLMTQLWWPGSACRGGRGSVTRERRRSKGGGRGGRQCVGGVGQQMLTSPKGKIEKKKLRTLRRRLSRVAKCSVCLAMLEGLSAAAAPLSLTLIFLLSSALCLPLPLPLPFSLSLWRRKLLPVGIT